MPFYIMDMNVHAFCYRGDSWKQVLTDIKGWLSVCVCVGGWVLAFLSRTDETFSALLGQLVFHDVLISPWPSHLTPALQLADVNNVLTNGKWLGPIHRSFCVVMESFNCPDWTSISLCVHFLFEDQRALISSKCRRKRKANISYPLGPIYVLNIVIVAFPHHYLLMQLSAIH